MIKIEAARYGWFVSDGTGAPPMVFTEGSQLLETIAQIFGIRGIEIVQVLEMVDGKVEIAFPSVVEGSDGRKIQDVPPSSDIEEPPASLGGDSPPA
jgi:hypothetical protein